MIIKRKTKSVSDLFYISSRPDLDGEYIKPKINLYPDVESALSGISAVPGEDTNIEGAYIQAANGKSRFTSKTWNNRISEGISSP